MATSKAMHDADHVQILGALNALCAAQTEMTAEFKRLTGRLDVVDELKTEVRTIKTTVYQERERSIAYRTRLDVYRNILAVVGSGLILSIIAHLADLLAK